MCFMFQIISENSNSCHFQRNNLHNHYNRDLVYKIAMLWKYIFSIDTCKNYTTLKCRKHSTQFGEWVYEVFTHTHYGGKAE